ncbi:MAG TPA: EAL domain-containing protein, partial [Duganella sp.]|uniref:EAL domain-containing protein n=1 Tax=Duganella sp. TaxID=1904440 RepID=UPI002ED47040
RTRLGRLAPLDGFGVDVEVTETALQTGAPTIAALRALRALGVRIAIDDFGTGYSCLNSLKHLPVDILKIDRSFICGIPDGDDGAIAAAIAAIGRGLGMRVVAEGVETAAQLQFVAALGCDEVQGFVHFPPLSNEDCARVLREDAAM